MVPGGPAESSDQLENGNEHPPWPWIHRPLGIIVGVSHNSAQAEDAGQQPTKQRVGCNIPATEAGLQEKPLFGFPQS